MAAESQPVAKTLSAMNIRILIATTVLLGGACSGTALGESLSCTRKDTAPNGEWTRVDLRLVVVGGKVTDLTFDWTISSGEPGSAHSCHIDTTADATKARLVVKRRTTLVTLPASDTDVPSILRIARLGNTYRVSLDDMMTPHCGFGAEYPQAVELTRGVKRCRVYE